MEVNRSTLAFTEAFDLNRVIYKIKKLTRTIGYFADEIVHHPTAFIGLIVTLLFIAVAVFAPHIAPYGPDEVDLEKRLMPPAWNIGAEHILGTDQLGRDILSRIIYGSRISLSVGFIAVMVSITVGLILGSLAGYFGGWFDEITSRFADLLLSFPFLIFAIGVMAVMGPGFWNLIFTMTFKEWVEFFRLVRGEVLSEKNKEYVEAAKMSGRSDMGIIFLEIIPNIFHSVIVLGTLRMGTLIILEASLSFLGLGVSPDVPSWGGMVNSGRDFIWNGWWISTMPGVALLLLVLSINLFGEGIRDIMDPKLKTD